MGTQIKVGVVIEDENNRILLIKEQLKTKPYSLWNVVKGTHEKDKSVFNTVKRECREEASMDVEIVNSLGAYVSKSGGKTRV